MKLAAATAGGLIASPALAKVATVRERVRSLAFYNTHTGESVRLVYWAPKEGYLRQALKELSWALRDHYTDESIPMDPKVLDLMYAMQLKLGTKTPFNIVSAYRSPKTNAMLRRRGHGVAKHSYHMEGKALDIQLPNRSAADLHRAALSLKAGGVGYYRRSDFVHIDTGPVRAWRG